MLARLARDLPRGDFLYEPKWDGFRCLAFAAGDAVALQSRSGKPLDRYFPEIVDALRGRELVLDGELVIRAAGGMDFGALITRIHPAASRVAELAEQLPASYIVFDLLAEGGDDLTGRPFSARRAALERVLAGVGPPLSLTPTTPDYELASYWLDSFDGRGLEGVVAKPRAAHYEPGRRTMIKVKLERTVDCVVAGLRRDGGLLVGLHDGGVLRHVGVCTSFTAERRRELIEELEPLSVPLAGHPWEPGLAPAEMEPWTPLAPVRVAEVAYDQHDGRSFRHALRFVRWRPDRDPATCTVDQLDG